jgi:hypothetical protein
MQRSSVEQVKIMMTSGTKQKDFSQRGGTSAGSVHKRRIVNIRLGIRPSLWYSTPPPSPPDLVVFLRPSTRRLPHFVHRQVFYHPHLFEDPARSRVCAAAEFPVSPLSLCPTLQGSRTDTSLHLVLALFSEAYNITPLLWWERAPTCSCFW